MPTRIGNLTFYIVEELAEKFKISPSTIYGYIRSGALPARRFGEHFQIEQSHLEKFLVGSRHEES